MKLMQKEFRRSLTGDGDVMAVLTESFGDKLLARYCMTYLAASAAHQAASHKIVRWFYFAMGVGITLVFGVIIRVFA